MKTLSVEKVKTIIQKPMRRVITAYAPQHYVLRNYFLSFPQMKFEIVAHQDSNNQKFNIDYLEVHLYQREQYRRKAFLPNIMSTGSVCLGNDFFFAEFDCSFEEFQQRIIHEFWSSHFNLNSGITDLHWYIEKLGYQSIFDYLDDWQRKTKENPKWVPDVDFFGL